MRMKTSYGDVVNVEKIKNQEDINNIQRRGYYGSYPEVGKYSEYLGPSDGGFVVYDAEDLERA